MSNVDFENSVVLVEEVLKKSPVEITEIVYLNSNVGKRLGPYIRKTFDCDCGLGWAYKTIFNDSNQDCENIAKIYSVFKKDNKLYVFEEYIVGQTLDSYIANMDFNVEAISKLFIDLCNAVNFLHTKFSSPIIHRDIKPSNILITKSGQVKLIDFGISRNYEENENTDTHKFGTVGYASPEQFGYKQTDIRSDIYSLGKVLEFLCDGKNWKSFDEKHLNNFNEVIEKACKFDPSDRYKNVSLLLRDYKNIQSTNSNKFCLALGHIWNILLSVTVIFFIIVVIETVCDPTNVNYQISIGQKICYCTMMIVFLFLGSWAALTYKPSLRQIFKKLPRFKLKHYIVFIITCIAGITILAFLAQLF